jgi:hypothetical protein
LHGQKREEHAEDAWIAGKNRSSIISSTCTAAAMTPMKAMSDR